MSAPTPDPIAPHQILVGDCAAILPGIPDGSIDLVITSPPYNIDLAYRSYDDRRGEADYLDWLVGIAIQIRRILHPDGAFFLNIAGSSRQPWMPFELIVRLRSHFTLQNHISWIKSIAIGTDSVGHHKPVQGARFLNRNHENLFHLTLDGGAKLDRLAVGVPFKDKSNIARRGHARDLRCRGDTWFIPYDTVQNRAGKFGHPAGFPVDLPRWCIRLHGRAAPMVLDPFAGSGTTLVAAAREGGQGIGIELDPHYAAMACTRLSDELAAQEAQRRQGTPGTG